MLLQICLLPNRTEFRVGLEKLSREQHSIPLPQNQNPESRPEWDKSAAGMISAHYDCKAAASLKTDVSQFLTAPPAI
jgi:hypothetical protein